MSFTNTIRSLGARAVGHEARVVDVSRLSPSLLRIRLASGRISAERFVPGSKIKVHVGDGAMRSYTPASVDPHRGRLDIVVFVQGDSAASRWASALHRDDTVHFLGPASSISGPSGDEPWVGFYGDETAIGLAEAIMGAAATHVVLGAIETRPGDVAALDHLSLDAVPRGPEVGTGLVEHARTLEIPHGPGVVWLSGEATSVLALRTVLLERGVPKTRLRIKPYWSVRGKAHRKTLERTALR